MKKNIFYIILLITSMFLLTSCMTSSLTNPEEKEQFEEETGIIWNADDEYLEGTLNIGYTDKAELLEILNDLNLSVQVDIPEIKVLSVKIDQTVEEYFEIFKNYFEENLDRSNIIRYIEPSYERELIQPVNTDNEIVDLETKTRSYSLNDYEYEKYLWGIKKIRAPETWDEGYTGTGAVVAVLDSGVDFTHPDLKDQAYTNPGYNPVTETTLEATNNWYMYHGTHVAGTIAGNGDNIVGVAPDAKIMDIPIFQKEENTALTFIGDIYAAKGMIWAVNNGADILHNSWGGGGFSYALADAINYASKNNVTVVASSGNSHTAEIYYPSCYPGVITVGATEYSDVVTSFSSRGQWMTVAAPGDVIFSSVGTDDDFLYTFDDPFAFQNGTSMAAPHVSGLAALLIDKHGGKNNITPYQITQAITKGAVDIEEEGFDIKSGYGRIDAFNTLSFELADLENGANFSLKTIAKKTTPQGSPVNLEGVYVTLINRDTEIKENYYAKTNMEGEIELPYIRPGDYELVMGLADPWYSTIMRNEFRSKIQISRKERFSATENQTIDLTEEFEATPKIVIYQIDSEYGSDIILENVDIEINEILYTNNQTVITDTIPDRLISGDKPLEIQVDETDPAGWYEFNLVFNEMLTENIFVRGYIEYNDDPYQRVVFRNTIEKGVEGEYKLEIEGNTMFPVF